MTSETQEMKTSGTSRIWILVSLFIFAGLLWVANWYFVTKYLSEPSQQADFGDMFGAVNALFTALAFAGLIYTVLLQRDQLAIQQQEIIESGKTQENLVQRQITAQNELFQRQAEFQEELRRKQVEHDKSLEQMRQDFQADFEQIIENRRKAREVEAQKDFENNILRAIRRELEALNQIYDQGIGAAIAQVQEGQVFLFRLGLTQDWFTIFNANAVHLGKINSTLAQKIIGIYALMKALIEEYRINNDYIADWEQIEIGLKLNSEDIALNNQRSVRMQWMVHQVARIRDKEARMHAAVREFYAELDKEGIK